jgi:type VI secretion system secreted protein Hcp
MQFEHLVKVPFDIHSGQASGKRLHGPVRIVKRIDKASPLLYQALCSNEGLSECKFKWYRNDPTGAGGQKHYFSTELEQAVLVEIKQWFPLTADLTRQNYSHFEECAFKYRKITWRWEDGGVTTMDDWQAADE